MSLFYIAAGVNHFIQPEFYIPLIPPYIPRPEMVNDLSGMLEIIAGVGLLFKSTQTLSAWLVILFLLAFIPSHIYFIQIDGCIQNGLCVPIWVAWVRLLVIHPLLLLWAWVNR